MRRLPSSKIEVNFTFFLVAIAFAAAGCNSGGSSVADTNTTDNGGGGATLTAADLAAGGYNGAYYSCTNLGTSGTFGSALNNYSILKAVSYTSSGNYTLDAFFYNTANCVPGNGTEEFLYTQSGTFIIASSTTTPSDGYDIQYDATSATLYSFTSTADSIFDAANCSAGGSLGTFSSPGYSTHPPVSITCSTGNLSMDFPPLGYFYDVIVPSSTSSPSSINVYSGISVFYMGQFSSYPTSAGTQFTTTD
jgi:hypothetical protein